MSETETVKRLIEQRLKEEVVSSKDIGVIRAFLDRKAAKGDTLESNGRYITILGSGLTLAQWPNSIIVASWRDVGRDLQDLVFQIAKKNGIRTQHY